MGASPSLCRHEPTGVAGSERLHPTNPRLLETAKAVEILGVVERENVLVKILSGAGGSRRAARKDVNGARGDHRVGGRFQRFPGRGDDQVGEAVVVVVAAGELGAEQVARFWIVERFLLGPVLAAGRVQAGGGASVGEGGLKSSNAAERPPRRGVSFIREQCARNRRATDRRRP